MRSGGELREIMAATKSLRVAEKFDDAWRLLVPALWTASVHGLWYEGWRVLAAGARAGWSPPAERTIRLALLSTFETAEFGQLLEVALRARGVDVTLLSTPFGQVEQELLDPAGGLGRFAPTHVVLSPCTQDLGLPAGAVEDPTSFGDGVVARWTGLWATVHALGAVPVQHTLVVPDDLGGHHLPEAPGTRAALVRDVNRRLTGLAAGQDPQGARLVDVESAASWFGKHRWLDERLWHASRQPAGYDALTVMARDTAAALAADVGLVTKCLVVDLDNTIWGGVLGEVGVTGIRVGPDSADGEAYAMFQRYLKGLRDRGVLLAVSSKNDIGLARAPFEQNPAMVLRLTDFVAFVADWRPKSEQLRQIAGSLGLILGGFMLVDDNPAECLEVSQALPSVRTVTLDGGPAGFARQVNANVVLEPGARSSTRSDSYAGKAAAESLRSAHATLPDFWSALEMVAVTSGVTDGLLERSGQLLQKTNQFNLTLRRRTTGELDRLRADPDWLCFTLALRDRLADHGVVGLCLAGPVSHDTLPIDNLVLSCRVIGRTAERHLLAAVSRGAVGRSVRYLVGEYVAGPHNGLVAGLYESLGFAWRSGQWLYDLAEAGPITSPYIVEDAA